MKDAKGLAQRVAHDPQIQIPTYPRMPEDIVKIWFTQQLLVLGGPIDDIALRGKSVENLLPQLLPLLKGRLTVEEIIKRVPGFQPHSVRDALVLLYMQGLIEEGAIPFPNLNHDLLRAFNSQLNFYSRYIDYTHANVNRYEVLSRMQASSVLVVGQGEAGRAVLAETAALGLGKAVVLPLDDDTAWRSLATPFFDVELLPLNAQELRDGNLLEIEALAQAIRPHNLVLLLTNTPNPVFTRLLNRLAIEQKVPFMRAYISENTVQLGPTVFPGESGCYECANLSGLINLDAAETNDSPPDTYVKPFAQIGVSHQALLTLANLTKFIPILTGDGLFELDQEMKMTPHALHAYIGCPVCNHVHDYDAAQRTLQVGPHHAENLSALFHLNTNDKAYRFFLKGHQVHYKSKNLKHLPGAYKQYTGRPRIVYREEVLQPPAVFAAPFAATQADKQLIPKRDAFAFDDLKSFIQMTAGSYQVPEQLSRFVRITPSGGSLASQTIYLVNFNIMGLPAGIYHASPVGHLDQLHSGSFRQELDKIVIGAEEQADQEFLGAVILTAAFSRLESKYLSKAYRYSHYDSGAMLQTVQSVGRLMGLTMWPTGDFYDDRLQELLGLSPDTELITYIVYFSLA